MTRGWRARLGALLPWVFILGVAVGVLLTQHDWLRSLLPDSRSPEQAQRERDSETLWRHAGNTTARHVATVIRTVDGDTFDARVALWPGLDVTTRVRLRGIDAPELKAECEHELRKAEAASAALRALLGEGDVTIFNIGPDKYAGRVVADAATRKTSSLSAAMISAGHARAYLGGRRESWCSGK